MTFAAACGQLAIKETKIYMKKKTHDEISIDRPKLETLPDVKKLPVVAILNNIRSTYNVGSIFRTSDGAMIQKLYCCGFTPAPPKKEILKTALGATESVAWEYVKEPMDVIVKIEKRKDYKIAALELTEGSIPHYKVPPQSFPVGTHYRQ